MKQASSIKKAFVSITIIFGVLFFVFLLIMLNIIDIQVVKDLHDFLLKHHKASMTILLMIAVVYFISLFICLKYDSILASEKIQELSKFNSSLEVTCDKIDRELANSKRTLIESKFEIKTEIKFQKIDINATRKVFRNDYYHILKEVVYANKHIYQLSQKTHLANFEELQNAFKEYESSLKWL